MTVLYVNLEPATALTPTVLRQHGHRVVSSAKCADALGFINRQAFDAVVIEKDEDELEILGFIRNVNQIEPRLPIFVATDWGAELTTGLEALDPELHPEQQ